MSQSRLPTLRSAKSEILLPRSSTSNLSPQTRPTSPTKFFPNIVITEPGTTSPTTHLDLARTISKGSTPSNFKSDTDGNSPVPPKKPLKLFMFGFQEEEENDEILGQALNRLDEVMRRQVQKREKKKTSEDEDRGYEERKGSVASKSQEIVQKITRLKAVKGINPKTKDIRFEERLSLFKDVKTFIDIRQVVREMSNDKSLSPERKPSDSPKNMKRSVTTNDSPNVKDMALRLPRNSYSSLLNSTVRDEATPPPPGFPEHLVTGLGGKQSLLVPKYGERLGSSVSDNVLKVIPTEEGGGIKKEENKEKQEKRRKDASMRIEHAYGELRNQVVKYMGPDVIEEMRKKMGNPKLAQKVRHRKQIDLYNVRHTQNKLRGTEVVSSLVEHLSGEGAPANAEGPLIGKEEGVEEFYTQIEKSLFADQYGEQDDDIALVLEKLNNEREEKEEEEALEKVEMGFGMKGIPQSLWEDEQVKIINAMQAYKKRSDRVIAILKKKTQRMNNENSYAYRRLKEDTLSVKQKLSSMIIDTPVVSTIPDKPMVTFSTACNYGIAEDVENEKESSDGTVRVGKSINVPVKSFFSGPGKPRTAVSMGRAGNLRSSTLSSNSFAKNIIENKKKFMELKDRKLSQNTNHLENRRTKALSTQGEEKSYLLRTYFGNQRMGKSKFDKSVSKLSDDVNSLLGHNKTLGNEIKHSIEEIDKFYAKKVQAFNQRNIPESLKLPKKGTGISKTAHMILDLTRDLLKA